MTSVPVVQLKSPNRSIRFDFACIARIEDRLGMTLSEIGERFLSFNALPQSEMQKPQEERREPTDAEKLEAAKRVSIGLVAKFVAACIDVDLDRLGEIVPQNRLLVTFGELSSGMGSAIAAMNEDEGPHPSETQAASSHAEPGQSQSSAAAGTTSTR